MEQFVESFGGFVREVGDALRGDAAGFGYFALSETVDELVVDYFGLSGGEFVEVVEDEVCFFLGEKGVEWRVGGVLASDDFEPAVAEV